MSEASPRYTWTFWAGLLLGVPVIGYGIRGVVTELDGPAVTSFVRFSVGAAVVHDLLVAPLVCALGWFVAKRLPSVAVVPVQAALIVTAIVGLVSWPLVRRYGETAGEPSFLSRDYAASVLGTWSVVWAVALVAIAARVIARRR